MITIDPIGVIHSSYTATSQIPKGSGTRHTAEGVLEIRVDLEAGLQDIEGFSHLFVLWIFHRSEGYDLVGRPPVDDRPHGVFATRSPRRPNPIALTVVGDLYSVQERARVQGYIASGWGAAAVIGPTLGGFFSDYLSWRWIFFLNIPIGVLAIAMALIAALSLTGIRAWWRANTRTQDHHR